MRFFRPLVRRRLLSAVIVIFVLLGIMAVWLWSSGGRLDQRIAAIRAAGEPVTVADLKRPSIPPDKNADTFLRRAQPGVDALDKQFWYQQALGDAISQWRLSESDQRVLAAGFAAYPSVMAQLGQAADCPDYDSQLDYTLGPEELVVAFLPRIQYFRSVARVLQARSCLLLSQGQRDEALRTCLVQLRLTRHYDKQPTLINYLVALACRDVAVEMTNRVLRDGDVPMDLRAELDDELAMQDKMDGAAFAFKSERTLGLANLQSLRSSWSPLNWRNVKDECDYLDIMAEVIATASEPRYKIANQFKRTVQRSQQVGPLTSLVTPTISATRDAPDRVQAQLRCLRVLNALQRSAARTKNSEPTLADLKLPAEATIDPLNGKPLLVKHSPQGITVYSVGTNLKDDDGTFDDLLDFGIGPVPEVGK